MRWVERRGRFFFIFSCPHTKEPEPTMGSGSFICIRPAWALHWLQSWLVARLIRMRSTYQSISAIEANRCSAAPVGRSAG